MVTISQTLSELKKKKPLLNAGGVLLLNNYLAIAKPEILGKIKGEKAIVEAKEMKNGYLYLFIKLPLSDDSYEELRVWEDSDLEEGNEVWISSIIAILLTNNKGEIVVRYDAIYIYDGESIVVNDVKSLMIHRCADIMLNSAESSKINIDITYEGNALPKSKDKVLIGNNNIILYNEYYYSDTWTISKLNGYTNAIRLSHGLILAEHSNKSCDILNSDGTIICHRIKALDYGPNYLLFNNHLWWFKENNTWEEVALPKIKLNFGEQTSGNVYKLEKLHIDDDIFFYIYENSYVLEICHQYTESDYEWEVEGGGNIIGLLDKRGIWRIMPSEQVCSIKSYHSSILVYKNNEVEIYDTKQPRSGCIQLIYSAEECVLKDHHYIILIKGGKQGLYNALERSFDIPCNIPSKYVLLPRTIGENLIGAYVEWEKIIAHRSFKRKTYYFIDFYGSVVIEVENGFSIYSGFRNGQAIISKTDDYHGEYYEETIDKEGKTIKQYNRSFPGYLADVERDDLRNLDRDNWDAMTDGMYGDYPNDGYDGDFDFMG